MITYLLPTRDRHETLRQTLDALGSLSAEMHEAIGGAEVIVIDNASSPPVEHSKRLRNGLPLRIIRLEENHNAAARNIGAQQANGEWIVMLDDDSYPLNCDHVAVLTEAQPDVAAIGAEIFLTNGQREAGGLPEVIIGCGAAIRRKMFLAVGGYDPTFDYYAEEYDLCAKFIIQGWRIIHDRRFRVLHEKITTHRDMNRILHRLVRNNGWVTQRYTPVEGRNGELSQIISRYAGIALKEKAACGFAQGVAELLHSLDRQSAQTMSADQYDRFTGLAQACEVFAARLELRSSHGVAVIEEGKNAGVVRRALHELGVEIVADERDADMLVIGTMSPGPMLDAWERRMAAPGTDGRPVLCGWQLQGQKHLADAVAA